MTVVIVSNRVARAHANEAIDRRPCHRRCSRLFAIAARFGSDRAGAFATTPPRHRSRRSNRFGHGAIATVDLPAAHYRGYYEGFSNSRSGRRCIRDRT